MVGVYFITSIMNLSKFFIISLMNRSKQSLELLLFPNGLKIDNTGVVDREIFL